MEQESKATIKIPRSLYRRLQVVVDRSGFDSVTDFITYVLRDLVSTSVTARAKHAPATETKDDQPFTPEELEQVTERLRALGYL